MNMSKKIDFLENLEPYHRILRLGGIKEVIRMSDEAIRELFCAFVEEGKLDEYEKVCSFDVFFRIAFGFFDVVGKMENIRYG